MSARRGSAQLERAPMLAILAVLLILAWGCIPQMIRVLVELAPK